MSHGARPRPQRKKRARRSAVQSDKGGRHIGDLQDVREAIASLPAGVAALLVPTRDNPADVAEWIIEMVQGAKADAMRPPNPLLSLGGKTLPGLEPSSLERAEVGRLFLRQLQRTALRFADEDTHRRWMVARYPMLTLARRSEVSDSLAHRARRQVRAHHKDGPEKARWIMFSALEAAWEIVETAPMARARLDAPQLRVRLAKAILHGEMPRAEVSDALLERAVELWPTRSHARLPALRELARALDCDTGAMGGLLRKMRAQLQENAG